MLVEYFVTLTTLKSFQP